MDPLPPPAVPESAPAARGRPRLARMAAGFVLGAALGLAAAELGVVRGSEHQLLIAAVAGAVVGLTRLRAVLWAANAAAVAGLLVIIYTPLAGVLIRGLERADAPRPAPAVVVLGSGAQRDHTLNCSSQERALRGYLLLRQGYAREIVLTRPYPDADPWDVGTREQMQALGLDYPVDVIGPVRNTHDEALAVAELARQRGWDSVLLVTHPWHMRRAAAVFEKAGVRVVCVPCAEGRYAVHAPEHPFERILAFRDWVRESVGYGVYRFRGWIG